MFCVLSEGGPQAKVRSNHDEHLAAGTVDGRLEPVKPRAVYQAACGTVGGEASGGASDVELSSQGES